MRYEGSSSDPPTAEADEGRAPESAIWRSPYPEPNVKRQIQGSRAASAAVALVVLAAVLFAAPGMRAQAATASVNCDAGGDLQAKIDAAASGSTILIKGTCFGNYLVGGKVLTLKGNPRATLDGNDTGSVLSISSAGTPVHLIALTVTGGAQATGAGITNFGGGLTLNKVTVTGNLVTDPSMGVRGGGIFSQGGSLQLTGSTVSDNRAIAFEMSSATGGGIFVRNGNLTIKNSVISGNRASAVPGSGAASALGGGFYLDDGNLTVQGSTITGNRVTASAPGNAEAFGSAGFDASGSKATVSGSVITENIATASSTSGSVDAGRTLALFATSEVIGGSRVEANRASGAAPSNAATVEGAGIYGGELRVTDSSVSRNSASATGSTAGAEGGGIHTVNGLTLVRSALDGNRLTATASGAQALADGGGVQVDSLTVTASTISRNQVVAKTTAAATATAYGGGGYTAGLEATNATIALNVVKATSPHAGGTSSVDGGGLDTQGSMVDSTVAGNTASASGGTVFSQGGGLFTCCAGALTLEATIVANNTAVQGPDCFGGLESDGHNLVRKTVGCSFAKKSTDVVGKDPNLGPLADNGGRTRTMAIAPASPARDAILAAACAVASDQRGVHRPQGPRCDIGAYERKVP